MALIYKDLPLIRLRSSSDPDKWYTINRTQKTCTCYGFTSSGHCSHLDKVGLYENKSPTTSKHPTFSQALSGLVKTIRMREVQEAIYWLVYLNDFKDTPKLTRVAARFRIARRILIAAAEDGHSVAVMEKVVSNFSNLVKVETPILYLAAEIVRICKQPSWWDASTGGHDYIWHSHQGDRIWQSIAKTYTEEQAKAELTQATLDGDKTKALGIGFALGSVGLSSTRQAEFVLGLAEERQNDLAVRLCRVHLKAKSALSGDNNFISQAIWVLAGGSPTNPDAIDHVVAGEVMEKLDQAYKDWKTPHPIPSHYCDGVHCAGNDRRYAGLLIDMWAVCEAFNHYGNINPDNKWLYPTFYPLTGLDYHLV